MEPHGHVFSPAQLFVVTRFLFHPQTLSCCHDQFALLSYMGGACAGIFYRPIIDVSLIVSTNATTVFGWFSNMTSVSGLLLWMCICITLIRFVASFSLPVFISSVVNLDLDEA